MSLLRRAWWRAWLKRQYRRYQADNPFKVYRFLDRSQWWERERLDNFRLMKVKKLLRYAMTHVPYYRERLKGLELAHFTLDDMKHLPVLTRDMVRAHFERLRTDEDSHGMVKAYTSGSTGTPMLIYRSLQASALNIGGTFRYLGWWGVKPGERRVVIWGRTDSSQRAAIALFKRLNRKLVNHTLVFDVFDLNPESITTYLARLRDFKPAYIEGYGSALKTFGQLMADCRLAIEPVRLKVVVAYGEVLNDQYRQLMEQAFGCPVMNQYGSRDGGLVAYECPEGGMHIQEESQYIWIDHQDEYVGTELDNFAMPLINYKVGDRLALSSDMCACGRQLALINKVWGRSGDMVRKPDGTFISDWIFYYIFKELSENGANRLVRQFKVIQEKNSFDVLIVKDIGYTESATDFIRQKMRSHIGDFIEIRFRFVKAIERERSGKLKQFVRKD
jgi:phenylacetate-CoA ligase